MHKTKPAPLAVVAFVFAASAAVAQMQQNPSSLCDTPGAIDDPRCQILWRSSDASGLQPGSAARIPVIRDAVPPQGSGTGFDRPQFSDQARNAPFRMPAPPDPPTEFQKFVEQSTGKLLPVFGADLFRQVPSTFAPVDHAPVTPDYALGPGDQLLVRGWGQIDLNVSPVVDRSGAVYIPQVGEIQVAGLRFAQVQDTLKSALGRVFHNFDLSVNLGQLRSIQVFVVGNARRPGMYTIGSLSTLVNAVFASGGPSPQGSLRKIRLTRLDRVVAEFDLYDLLLRGDKSHDVRLLPGDVIYIPPAGPQVALTGSLNTPAIYEIRPGDTLEDALQLAGGLTPVAATKRVVVERIEDSSRRVLEVSMDPNSLAATRLRNGDIINILPIVPRFENAVTLRGNVADPIRMPWHAGMRVRDLIPSREALLTRDYWRNRNRLDSAPIAVDETESAGEESDLPLRDVSRVRPGDTRTGPAAVALGLQNTLRQSEPRQATNAPGSIAATKPETEPAPVKNRVTRNPLEVNWAYAVIERQDPKDLHTALIPFRLGKAILENDEAENLLLQPGDIVTVFSTADLKVPQGLQTRYVRLEGEFQSAGVYSVRPGETLRQLVQRAGGLTSDAYLYGSEFLRESTRLEQQQRLDDLADSLERQVASAAANIRGSVVSPEEAAAAATQISNQRELVEKLRKARASGRIVLDLDPRIGGSDGLPGLALEDGDTFVVPSKPSFVNVIGAVYNASSFLYDSDKRLGDYLRESGGATRTGDSRHAFLIRADGSVISKGWAAGLLTQSFEGLKLNPGDTIVVPEQINKTTFLKGLKDWSQIIAQFGLGAAAINVLK